MGLIARLAAAAPPRAFPVLGWDGERLWDALRRTDRVQAVRAPHDADLLVLAGEIPDAWYADLLDLYETLALPRLALWLGPDAPTDEHAISLPGALHLGVDELDAHWPALLAALHDLDRPNNRPVLPDRPPAPWRGIGPHGQGGEGMMGGQPYGRPMAMTAEDPDQLALGDVPTALGPFFPGLPSGLQVDLRL